MSVVLVVKPDAAQANTLREISERIGSDFVMVDSILRAVEAIAVRTPDLILLSALLSPRDEDALMMHLRTLEGAAHLQTLTIPQFSAGTAEAGVRKSAFGFRKKAKAAVAMGCDPAVFADDIVSQLRCAAEVRSRPVAPKRVPIAAPPPEPLVFAEVETTSAPEAGSLPEAGILSAYMITPDVAPAEAEPPPAPIAVPDEAFDFGAALDRARIDADNRRTAEVEQSQVDANAIREAALAEARAAAEQEAREAMAVDLARVQAEAEALREAALREAALAESRAAAERKAREAAAADLARVQAEAEALREAALHEAALAESRATAEREAREVVAADLARVQAEAEALREAALRETALAEARVAAEREAREAVAADLVRMQAEAEAARKAAIAEARAAAEREALEALDLELARVRSETEVTVADALNKAKIEAEQAERVRIEAEGIRAESERARVEAQEAFAAELARVRAEVERSLSTQLDASRAEAERMRATEASAAHDRAAAEAQLKSEIDRLRFVATQTRKADQSETKRAAEQVQQLERELAMVHAKAEEREAAQLEELRVQMAALREAAAQQARAAAAEAIASEVARAAAQSSAAARKLNVIRVQPRAALAPVEVTPALTSASVPLAFADEGEALHPKGDYYKLWQPPPPVAEAELPPEEPEVEERAPIDFRRHAKWALPAAAACLLLITNTGTAISTATRFMAPAENPVAAVEPVEVAPFVEPVATRKVGSLQIESTPTGAEAIVDGRSYGATPVTIPDLGVGTHTVMLKSSAGTITRKISVKADQTATLSEAIYSGWLAIFSPFPVQVVVDGQPATLTDDGRLMTTSGKHVVELISERFNYRATETFEVRPGETTAHTLSAPMGSVRVEAPEGAEVRVDGQPATVVAGEPLALAVGSHEISATHAEHGERRVTIDVRHDVITEVALQFPQ